MSEHQEGEHTRTDSDSSAALEILRQQFIEAWEAALRDGPCPEVDSFICLVPEADRATFRTDLEALALSYRDRLRGRKGSSTSAPTSGHPERPEEPRDEPPRGGALGDLPPGDRGSRVVAADTHGDRGETETAVNRTPSVLVETVEYRTPEAFNSPGQQTRATPGELPSADEVPQPGDTRGGGGTIDRPAAAAGGEGTRADRGDESTEKGTAVPRPDWPDEHSAPTVTTDDQLTGPTATGNIADESQGAPDRTTRAPNGCGLRRTRGAGARRRYGRRLHGSAARAESGSRAQDDPRGRTRGRARGGAVPHGSRGRGPAAAPQRRSDLRGRRRRRPTVLLAGVRGRRDARQEVRGRPATPAGLGPNPPAPRRGDGRGPPARDHPPRPQAGEHPAHPGRHAQDHRLRPRQATRNEQRKNAERGRIGNAQLHGAGAGQRRHQSDRTAFGRLRSRRDPLRSADRSGALQGGESPRHARASSPRESPSLCRCCNRAPRAIWKRFA